MGNTFLKKSYTKHSRETNPRPSSKKSKLSITLDKKYKVLCSFFLLYAQVEDYQIY